MLKKFARFLPVQTAIRVRNTISPVAYRLLYSSKESFHCPVCGYEGPFRDLAAGTGYRAHAQCVGCGAKERHRIQAAVMERLGERLEFGNMSLLHFAPETFFRDKFSQWFGSYTTADLNAPNVDHQVDLTDLPFADGSFDAVYASHVLEHIGDDRKAISEIRRVLRPGGFAVLPVPLVSEHTVEYPQANPHESFHVRAPGVDYFDRYSEFFARVEHFSSTDFPPDYQLYTYEDRSVWPTPNMPLRQPMQGDRHIDIVPVCFCSD